MCRIASFCFVTEAQRKHVRRRASLVAVACFFPGQDKDLSAPFTSPGGSSAYQRIFRKRILFVLLTLNYDCLYFHFYSLLTNPSKRYSDVKTRMNMTNTSLNACELRAVRASLLREFTIALPQHQIF